MSNRHEVDVDGSKYTFVIDAGWDLHIHRHGAPWVKVTQASKAIHAMMSELDAARLVVQAVQRVVAEETTETFQGLENALARHRSLVGEPGKPSAWTKLPGEQP